VGVEVFFWGGGGGGGGGGGVGLVTNFLIHSFTKKFFPRDGCIREFSLLFFGSLYVK